MSNIKRKITTVLILTVFIVYFIVNFSEFRRLLSLNPILLVLASMAYSLTILVNGFAIKLLTKPFKIKLTLLESLKVSIVSTAGNFFASSGGGMGIRAVYLKKKYSLSYTDYLSVVAANYVLVFIVSSIIGLVSLQLLDINSGAYFYVINVLFLFLITVSTTVIYSVRSKRRPRLRFILENNKILSKLAVIKKGLNTIFMTPSLIIWLIGVTFLNFLISFTITLFITRMLSIDIGFFAMSLLTVLASLSVFINITPANLGVKEAVYVLTSVVIGLGVNEALAIALIDRAILFIVISSLWLFTHKMFGGKLVVDVKQDVV